MTRGRGTCWPGTVTPPPWPSLTSDLTWSVGRRFYIGECADLNSPSLLLFLLNKVHFLPNALSQLCSYEVQLESRVRRKGLGKFLIQILQLIANR